MLQILFPGAINEFSHASHDYNVENRISSLQAFTKYFHADLSSNTFSSQMAYTFLQSVDERIRILQEIMRSVDSKNFISWLDFLFPFLTRVEAKNPLDLAKLITKRAKPLFVHHLHEDLSRFILQLIDNAKPKDKSILIESIIRDCSYLAVSTSLLITLLSKAQLYSDGEYKAESEAQDIFHQSLNLSTRDIILLKNHWCEKINSIIKVHKTFSDAVDSEESFIWVLHIYGQLQSYDKVSAALCRFIQAEGGIGRFINLQHGRNVLPIGINDLFCSCWKEFMFYVENDATLDWFFKKIVKYGLYK